ncbi:MAG: thioredoxin [Nostocaceae cyanobacterium]|nr:thioredoxin [Nostocaceae cyanobacterium]
MAIKKEFNKFRELVSSSEMPVLVDFYADWCEPCRIMAPIVEQVDIQMNQQLKMVRINTDNCPHLAEQHHIHVLPTLVLFKQGKPVVRLEGIMSAEAVIQRLQGLV